MTRARILLADDHKEMRDQVVLLLEQEFDILAALESGEAIVEATAKLCPDVCLLDISMPVLSGIEVAEKLKEKGSTAKVIFLTVHEDPDFVQAALKTKSAGYVIKRRLASDLLRAIRAVLDGGTFISPSLYPY
jgi:DNA-binding NarL/FixJ family response regulator